MRGTLGEKIGEGGSADIHAWAPGRVVKLFKPGIDPGTSRHEAQMTRAAFAAGLPAPQVFDEVTVDGRFGVVLSRLDGPTLLQLVKAGALTREQTGAILAALALAVHRTPPPACAMSVRKWVHVLSREPGHLLPQHLVPGVFTLLKRLPPEDGLCHGDLHPGNVIMTAEGPRLIDWTFMRRAGGGLDLAHCHVSLTEIVPEGHDDPERPRATNAAMQAEYARLTGLSPAALTAAIDAYLPLVRAFLLFVWPGPPTRRAQLIERVEAALHEPTSVSSRTK
jgi:Ser/Thr protein kinase RdoA (MazF antagonist)